MQHLIRTCPAAAFAALVSLSSGCATPPPADRIVYEVRQVPVVVPSYEIPARSAVVVRDDPEAEAARRAWLEENYGWRRVQAPVPAEDRYVPQQEVVRERVIYREPEPPWYTWIPPIALSFGYWHGGGHHDGWGWGVGSGWGWGRPCW